MSDALETFILTGDARAVDQFWAEHGMGWVEIKLSKIGSVAQDRYGIEPNGQERVVPHYTTDRGLRYVIEDRMRECKVFDWYAGKIAELYGIQSTDHLRLIDVQPYGEFVMSLTNRQVILAAARAMGLEAPV